MCRVWTFLFALVVVTQAARPNTCRTFKDYRNVVGNPNCWFNPEVSLGTEQFASKHGYPIETYPVETKDGYIINLFRMPQRNRKRGVVILHHPALSSSSVWVDKGNYSLGFQIYDQGFEVWLTNTRGNKNGRKHRKLSTNNAQFWDYSIDELIQYDIPAQLNVIKKVTSDPTNMVFLGHSLGGSLGIMLPIVYPEESKKLFKTYIVIAPATTFKHTRVPFTNLLAAGSQLLERTAKNFNMLELSPPIINFLMKQTCSSSIAVEFCAHVMYMLLGPSFTDQVKPEWMPLFFHQQSTISVKIFLHLFNNRRSGGKFQAFDYGTAKNLRLYNSANPPEYVIENIRQPIYFISGGKDDLCTAEDTEDIYQRLPAEYKIYGHKIFSAFNHMDFLYGRNTQLFNDDIIAFLNQLYK